MSEQTTFSEDESKSASEKHKFMEDSEMSYEEVYNFAYNGWFIPFMKNLADIIGEDKFINFLKKTSSKIGAESGKKWEESLPNNDFSTFVKTSRSLLAENRFWKHILTHEIIEASEKVYEVKYTECLWAKTFRDANASDIGYACVCNCDFSEISSFNPKIELLRTKTLMQGHDCCNFRWVLEN
jgi:hypothetical protein